MKPNFFGVRRKEIGISRVAIRNRDTLGVCATPRGINHALQIVIVRDDRDAVLALAQIHLEQPDAVLDAVLERAEGVLGVADGAAAVRGDAEALALDLLDEGLLGAGGGPEDVVHAPAAAADDDAAEDH